MLKVWTPKASREAENKSGITEGYLFNGYSKRKLYMFGRDYMRSWQNSIAAYQMEIMLVLTERTCSIRNRYRRPRKFCKSS